MTRSLNRNVSKKRSHMKKSRSLTRKQRGGSDCDIEDLEKNLI